MICGPPALALRKRVDRCVLAWLTVHTPLCWFDMKRLLASA